MQHVIVHDLGTWEIANNGVRALVSFVCEDGSEAILDLPMESLNGLIMTLPAMMTKALRTVTATKA